jgi:hypothetical protein
VDEAEKPKSLGVYAIGLLEIPRGLGGTDLRRTGDRSQPIVLRGMVYIDCLESKLDHGGQAIPVRQFGRVSCQVHTQSRFGPVEIAGMALRRDENTAILGFLEGFGQLEGRIVGSSEMLLRQGIGDTQERNHWLALANLRRPVERLDQISERSRMVLAKLQRSARIVNIVRRSRNRREEDMGWRAG